MGFRVQVEGICFGQEEDYVFYGENERKKEKCKSKIGKKISLLVGVEGIFFDDFYCFCVV